MWHVADGRFDEWIDGRRRTVKYVDNPQTTIQLPDYRLPLKLHTSPQSPGKEWWHRVVRIDQESDEFLYQDALMTYAKLLDEALEDMGDLLPYLRRQFSKRARSKLLVQGAPFGCDDFVIAYQNYVRTRQDVAELYNKLSDLYLRVAV